MSIIQTFNTLLGLNFDPARHIVQPPWNQEKPKQARQERKQNEPDRFGFVAQKPTGAANGEWAKTTIQGKADVLTDEERHEVAAYTKYKLDVNMAARLKPLIIDESRTVSEKAKDAGISQRLFEHYRAAINAPAKTRIL